MGCPAGSGGSSADRTSCLCTGGCFRKLGGGSCTSRDRDTDGVCEPQDNCAETPNPDQNESTQVPGFGVACVADLSVAVSVLGNASAVARPGNVLTFSLLVDSVPETAGALVLSARYQTPFLSSATPLSASPPFNSFGPVEFGSFHEVVWRLPLQSFPLNVTFSTSVLQVVSGTLLVLGSVRFESPAFADPDLANNEANVTLLADRNECVEISPCAPNARCTDTWGAFECECNFGYGDPNLPLFPGFAGRECFSMVPPGLRDGESFRVMFRSLGITDATSDNMSYYDAFVAQGFAGSKLGAFLDEALLWGYLQSAAWGVAAIGETPTDPLFYLPYRVGSDGPNHVGVFNVVGEFLFASLAGIETGWNSSAQIDPDGNYPFAFERYVWSGITSISFLNSSFLGSPPPESTVGTLGSFGFTELSGFSRYHGAPPIEYNMFGVTADLTASFCRSDCHPLLEFCSGTFATGFLCACAPGAQLNGSACQDLDECQLNTHNCGLATCVNTVGSFTCA